MFVNRYDSGKRLSTKLEKFKDEETIVLAIPRGGLITAYETIKRFGFQWDLIIPRKIPSPYNEEIAIGAISLDESLIFNEKYIDELNISKEYINEEILKQTEEIKRRLIKYKGNESMKTLENKTVIIIDDGIATGFTVKAAINSIKKHFPRKIILAVPVASQNTITSLEKIVDEVICICVPYKLYAVSLYYEDFKQTTDEEVISIVNELNRNSN